MRTITAHAPVRVCDCGGWTDTWFARHGRVFNIAVRPGVEVRIDVFPGPADRPRVLLDVVDYGDRYVPTLSPGAWERHPLLEAAIASVGLPPDTCVEISLSSRVPAGASTGTSAAVTVALIGALWRLNGRALDRHAIARAAHEVETIRLGQQSGIQDQICSAFGGVNDIAMTAYPEAAVRTLVSTGSVRSELERRLSVVVLGGSHTSTDLHRRVITRIEGMGPGCAELEALRRCAADAARAFEAGDLAGLGRAMADNTEAQRRLHPDLVCDDAERVIAIARAGGSAGWKVNGAGGVGGSLTILGPVSADACREMLAAIQAECPTWCCIRPTLDMDGLRVTDA